MAGTIKKGAERLQKEIQELGEKKARHLENAGVFEEQLEKMRISKAQDDEIKSKQIDGVLDDLPTDVSSKGVLEKLLKMKTGESRQLSQNMEKVQIAIANERRKAGQCEVQIRQLVKELDALRFNAQAENVAKCLDNFITGAKKLDELLQALKVAAASCEEISWHDRLPKLGYSNTYMAVASAFLNPQSLQGLTPHYLLERIENLGTSYGPALLNYGFINRTSGRKPTAMNRGNF